MLDKKIGIGLACVVVAVVVSAIVGGSPTTKQQVIVSGTITTEGPATKPIRVDFETNGGKKYSADVSSNHYSIELPAPESYKVKVAYLASGVLTLPCDWGTLDLPISPNPKIQDIKC